MRLFNRFLDPDDVVPEKPNVDYTTPTQEQVDALQVWCAEVKALGRKASKRVVEACDSQREKKTRKVEPYVSGVYARMLKLDESKFFR